VQAVKKIFFASLSFLGWVLSPFTWWNDAFVNLPLAYLSANVINRALPRSFPAAFLITYWFTNVLGIALMYIGAGSLYAKGLIKNKRRLLLNTLIIYSIISAFLIRLGILKPF